MKRMMLGLLMAVLPSVAHAQQENYLPSKSQLYYRYDGRDKHKDAYDKTAVGKMMQGETGKFCDELWNYAMDNLKAAADNKPELVPIIKDVTKVLVNMHKNGLVLAVEVDTFNPPVVQAVLVFPKAAGESGTVLSLIQTIAKETNAQVKNTKVGNRFVNTIEIEVVKLGWWGQGGDAVVFLGTTDPIAYAKDIDAKKTGIAKNPLYQKVAKFNDFTTASRGFLDITSLLNKASDIAPPVGKVIDELGVKGLKSITYVSGYDGPSERCVIDLDASGPRKGLLALTSQKKISLKDLPVLPNDVTNFSAGSANLTKSYDILTKLIVGVAGVVVPDEVENVKEGIKAVEGVIGLDLNKDLFENFGDVVVSYNSPSDGFLGTGAVVAIQLKDGKKMAATLDKLITRLADAPIPGAKVTSKKTKYRGGDIIRVGLEGPQINSHLATIGVYKNWLVYSQFPTPIKGFILRQEGVLPAWKADAALTKVLADFPSEFNSIQVSDPRPTVQTLLTVAPFALNLANTFGGLASQFGGFQYRPFDLDLIPHSQEATLHLFPNVTVSTDDGKRVRSESRGSLLFPF